MSMGLSVKLEIKDDGILIISGRSLFILQTSHFMLYLANSMAPTACGRR
jgi:hypothetical protein